MTGALEIVGSRIPLRRSLLGWMVIGQGGDWLITVVHNQEFTPR
jgi:hypothetical protein